MKLVVECLLHAEEYRKLAAQMTQPEEKHALEVTARAWKNAANKREAQLLKQIDRQTGIDRTEMIWRWA
jgi:hypothetical protein